MNQYNNPDCVQCGSWWNRVDEDYDTVMSMLTVDRDSMASLFFAMANCRNA
jgi:hypothetical protein